MPIEVVYLDLWLVVLWHPHELPILLVRHQPIALSHKEPFGFLPDQPGSLPLHPHLHVSIVQVVLEGDDEREWQQWAHHLVLLGQDSDWRQKREGQSVQVALVAEPLSAD